MVQKKTRTKASYAGQCGFNSKSTATAAQHARVLDLLAAHSRTTGDPREAPEAVGDWDDELMAQRAAV